MSQNPYGQTPPGQPYGYGPAQPNGYGQQPTQQGSGYPQAAPQQPYGYGAPSPEVGGYPVQNPYGAPGGYGSTPTSSYGAAPAKRSPLLAGIGLALVVVCGVILSVLMAKVGALIGPFAVAGTVTTDDLSAAALAQVSSLVGFASICGLGGLVGWILCIVATATRRGRALGVVGIILGVLALPIAFVALFVGFAPYMS